MAELVYGIITIIQVGRFAVVWLFHFVSLGVHLQSRKSSIFWIVTERGQNKPQIWNPRPRFDYSLYNFYRATMTIKGTLLLNNSLVKRSVER